MHNYPLLQKMIEHTFGSGDSLADLEDEVEAMQRMYSEELRHRVAISNLTRFKEVGTVSVDTLRKILDEAIDKLVRSLARPV